MWSREVLFPNRALSTKTCILEQVLKTHKDAQITGGPGSGTSCPKVFMQIGKNQQIKPTAHFLPTLHRLLPRSVLSPHHTYQQASGLGDTPRHWPSMTHSAGLLVSHPRRLPLERGLSQAQRAATRACESPEPPTSMTCEVPGAAGGPPRSCTPCLPVNSPYGLSVWSMDRVPPLRLWVPSSQSLAQPRVRAQ